MTANLPSLAQLAVAYDLVNVSVVLHDSEAAPIYANTAAQRLLGLHVVAGRVLQKDEWCLVHPDGAVLPASEHPAAIALRTGHAVSGTLLGIVSPRSDTRWLQVDATPLLDEHAAVHFVVVNYTDLPSWRQQPQPSATPDPLAIPPVAPSGTGMGSAPRDSAAHPGMAGLDVTLYQQAQVFQHLSDAVIVTDLEGRITDWNPAARTLFGYHKDEVLGHKTAILHRPKERETLSVQIMEGIVRDGVWIGEITCLRNDGTEVLCETKIAPMYDTFGVLIGTVGVNRDITQLRRLAELQRMNDFLSIASHELRTPLTSIYGMLQIVQRRLLRLRDSTAPQVDGSDVLLGSLLEMLTRTIQQFARLNRLVDDLLDVARVQAGRLALRIEQTDLREIVREVADTHKQADPERRFVVLLPAEAVPVLADADRIGQVVANYLTNALKYAPRDKPIEVGLQVLDAPEDGSAAGKAPGYAQVWVRDYGPGIPAAEQEHLWERFYRVQGIEARQGSQIGLGLGLHISRTIIERHGGKVGLDSEQGRGARFWFNLPLVPMPDPGTVASPSQP